MNQQTEGPALPRYISQKVVGALKIASIVPLEGPTENSAAAHYRSNLHFEDPRFGAIEVDAAFMAKHNPQPGMYLVQYQDGYRSVSPGAAFEAGNTPEAQWGVPRHQEPKYGIGERGRLINRASGQTIPDEEPVFILRAQDQLAMAALTYYRQLLVDTARNTDPLDERILAFSGFRDAFPERMKLPDAWHPPVDGEASQPAVSGAPLQAPGTGEAGQGE